MSPQCPSVESGEAGKAPSCQGCPNASICSTAKPDPRIDIIKSKLKNLKLSISVMSGKGGVGKSTSTVGVAAALAERGISVLILDLDISGPSIPRMTNTIDAYLSIDAPFSPIKVSNNLYAISAANSVSMEVQSRLLTANIKNDILISILSNINLTNIDVLVIDTPPNTTDEHIALAQIIKPSLTLVVTTPQKVSLSDVKRQLTFCRKAGIDVIGLVENMNGYSCNKCCHINYPFQKNSKKFCENEGIKYFGSISFDREIAKALDQGQVIRNQIYEEIADRLLKHMR